MKNDNVKFKMALMIVIVFSVWTTIYASDDYTLLAPLPGISNTSGDCVGTNCKTDLQTYLPAAFNLSIGIAAALAFVMVTFGGIMYTTSDAISGKSQGKEYIENALWGLLLVIGAWVILNTINPQILKFNLSLQRPEIQAGIPTAEIGVRMTPEALAADAAVRARLVGITVNHGPCDIGQVSVCTNLNGLPDNAVNGLNRLKIACGGCNIIITGGTEGGHQTHGDGKPMVDLHPTSDLNAFLSRTNPQAVSPIGKPNPTRVVVGGATYTYENTGDNGRATAPHWHVSFP